MNCKLKLHSKGSIDKNYWRYMRQKTQNHFFKFSIHLSVRKSRENYRQIYGKSKASLWRNLSTGTPQNFLGQSFALQLQFTIDIFFRTAVLRKLFDIRFSYKHCNFSRICLLVKMASKTVTRSIHSRDSFIHVSVILHISMNVCIYNFLWMILIPSLWSELLEVRWQSLTNSVQI